MPKKSPPTSAIRFKAKLLKPADTAAEKGATWTFVVLPKEASAKLPSRSMTSVEGTMNGAPFLATLEPDGQKSHWLKVDRKLRVAAGAVVGDTVAFEIVPSDKELEPTVPPDLKKMLASNAKARAAWDGLTTIARRDWIHWLGTAKQEKTRVSRIASTCDMLLKGKRRVCCFDRSGFFDKSMCAPAEAE